MFSLDSGAKSPHSNVQLLHQTMPECEILLPNCKEDLNFGQFFFMLA